MSTPFYDLASLVLVPSGYKSQKVYAQKPLTTDGQLTFSRASTATRVNSAGLIETVSSNVPRLDYLGSTCPKLQLEPSRTNILIDSEQINLWASAGGSAVANTVISPDGTQNADTLTGAVYQVPNVTGTYTFSLFAKKTSGNNFITLRFDTPTTKLATFNLNTGVVTFVDSGYSATITPYANGWYRCTFTTPPSTNVINTVVYPESGGTLSTYVWGAMLEAGSYATSYVKTTTAAVTRLADACSKTGISSLIGQTEGTIFFDLPPTNFSGSHQTYVLIELAGNIGAGYIHMYKEVGLKEARFAVRNAGVVQCDMAYTLVDNTRYKIAAVYKNNRFELYVNGVLRASDNTGTLAAITMDKIQIAQDSFNANSQIPMNQMLLFKSALTEAQCKELTTL